jgi:signal transduction histidine kinase
MSKREYTEQLEELSRLTGELAHELKNPLSTIKINLKLVSEDLADSNNVPSDAQSNHRLARAVRKIAVIQKELDRLEQILDGFLKYVGKVKLQPADVDVNELVGDMVDFYSPQCYSRSITVRVALYNKPLVCKVDADMLKQIILNLFINAQQAIDAGGELIIKTAAQNQSAVIQISDTGRGIAPEKLAKIFDAFYSSRPQGVGLGLATVKKIIEAHKGSINVDSEPGKGTQFTIKLPLSVTDRG